MKRIGGGFGGKETAASLVALPVAVAARKHGRPVRCMLDRDEDMVVVGGRHPFIAKYKVGASLVPSVLCRVGFAGGMGGLNPPIFSTPPLWVETPHFWF